MTGRCAGDRLSSPFPENLFRHAEEVLDEIPPIMHIDRRSAEVAELVDALGSGSSWGSPVEVRVFSSAPLKNQGFIP